MKIKYIISLGLLSFILSSCGSGTTSEEGTTDINIIMCDNSNNAFALNNCGNSLVPDYYTCIENGMSLIENTPDTVIKIVHSPSNKKVCVQSGSAYIAK